MIQGLLPLLTWFGIHLFSSSVYGVRYDVELIRKSFGRARERNARKRLFAMIRYADLFFFLNNLWRGM